jgi:hypothetical protein
VDSTPAGDALAVRDCFIDRALKIRGVPHPAGQFAPAWLGHLARTAFLVTPGVGSFLGVTVPSLLRKLSCSTEARPVEMQGAVRGRIDWAATWKARHTGDPNPALFICREVERQYATPENELLRYVLEKLKAALGEVPPLLRGGACWPAGAASRPASIAPLLADLQDAAQRHLRHAALRKIKPPDSIAAQHLLRARSSKTAEYGEVAKMYRDYAELTIAIQDGSAIGKLREYRCVVLPASLAGPGRDLVEMAALTLMA